MHTSIDQFMMWSCQKKPSFYGIRPLPYFFYMQNHNPFRYFKMSSEIIRLTVMMYVRFPLSLRNIEDLLHERSIDICHKTVRYWLNHFGPMFAKETLNKPMCPAQNHSNWRWQLNEVFMKINGEMHYL